jgi:DNA replication protein DnaC
MADLPQFDMDKPGIERWVIPIDPAAPAFCAHHDLPLIDGGKGLYCHPCLVHQQRMRDEAKLTADAEKDAAARRQADIDARLGYAAIPPRFADQTFDTFPGTNPEARATCNLLRSYANTFRSTNRPSGISILLLGGTGTGKTGLAICIANVVVRTHGMTAAYMKAYGAVRHQRDTWGRKGKTELEALQDLIAPDLLVLDEVGSSVGTAAEMAMLFEVIDGRYAEKKPTILVSNLALPELRSFLGSRILDRFNDDSSFAHNCDWPSLRGAPTVGLLG